MVTPLAIGFQDVINAILSVFLLLQWQLPVLPIACVVLGYLTAKRTSRSVFNWVLIGLLNGVIPFVGPLLMVVAYFFMPPPPPRVGPGYHPPRDRESRPTRRGTGSPKDRR